MFVTCAIMSGMVKEQRSDVCYMYSHGRYGERATM